MEVCKLKYQEAQSLSLVSSRCAVLAPDRDRENVLFAHVDGSLIRKSDIIFIAAYYVSTKPFALAPHPLGIRVK